MQIPNVENVAGRGVPTLLGCSGKGVPSPSGA